MIKFEFNYNGKELVDKKGYATLLEVAQDICNKAGVELGSTSFLNSKKQIAVYDNTITAREYISYIAESAGCFACIGRDGKLYFRAIGEDETEISLEMFGEYKWGEEFQISKVSYEDGIRSFKFGDETRNNLWINQDNMFIVDKEQVQNIYNKVKGLTINSFEGKTVIDPCVDIGDKIIIDGKTVIYQGEMTLEGRFIAQISSKIQIKQKEETTVKKESQTVVNRRVQSEINQIDGKIKTLVEEVGDRTEESTSITQDINGITQSVSKVKTEIKTVDGKADKAQSTANTAKSTADSTNKNLSNNYYTKTETNSQITQKAESITSEVSKTYSTKTETSTAKTEAINSANSSTDNKLKGYTETSKLGTAIEQNYEHVKVAWNQISDFIQMMIINKNASLAILDKNKNVMMALDKEGQHFYKDDGTEFGEMGVNTIDNQNYISFGVTGNYGQEISDGMALGITTKKDNKFWPILYIKNFVMSEENSDGSYGELVLSNCNLVLDGVGTGMKSGGVFLNGDPTGFGLYFWDEKTNKSLLAIHPENVIDYASITILDNIKFYANQAGSNSFKLGTGDNYCLFTDDGAISGNNLYINGSGTFTEYLDCYKNINCDGNVYAKNISSDKRLKKNIKNANDNAIKQINKIKIKSFDWKEDNVHTNYGFIAQELEKIDKNYVLKQKVKDKNIDYKYYVNELPILATATKAIQEQQEQIEQLQEKDKQKDELIQSLIQRIETLEKEVNK